METARICPSRSRSSGFSVFRRRDRGGRRGARLRRAERQRATRARSSTRSIDEAKQLGGRRTGLGAARRKAPCRARPQGRGRRRRSAGARARPAPGRPICCSWRPVRTPPTARMLGAAAPEHREAREPARSRTATSSSGSSTSRCSTGCEEEKRWEFMHHPFTSPLEIGCRRARIRSGQRCARAPTTWC